MNRGAPVIVLIGRNRGIGFEICRQLASRGAQVVLTTRKPEAGHDAANKLAWQKRSARFHPLNVRGRIPRVGHQLAGLHLRAKVKEWRANKNAPT
jgi:NAD(P)-dependent dehydrogenase (short-subunit alcohol dehydrogenase family)